MAFRGHFGGVYQGTGSMPVSTFHTFLDDIVSDVSAAVASGTANGWSLYDDMRNMTGNMVVGWSIGSVPNQTMTGGLNAMSFQTTLTNASTQVTGVAGQGAPRFVQEFGATGTYGLQISSGTSNTWYTIGTVVTEGSMSLTGNFAGTTGLKPISIQVTGAIAGHNYGYIVLKGSGTEGMNDLYVQIMKPGSYAHICRVQAFETWVSATHTGTNGGPQDVLRGYYQQQVSSSQISYAIGLFSGAFVLYAGPSNPDFSGSYRGDLAYYGNIQPSRGAASDLSASVWACTNQALSVFGVGAFTGPRTSLGSLNNPSEGATILRGIGNTIWSSGTQAYSNCVGLVPRGRSYLDNFTSCQIDNFQQFQLVGIDVYQAIQLTVSGDNFGRRGALRYLRYPLSWPSGLHLIRLSPSDDNNDYLLLRTDYPGQPQGSTAIVNSIDAGSGNSINSGMINSGFAAGGGVLITTNILTVGEMSFQNSGNATNLCRVHRFICVPTNI